MPLTTAKNWKLTSYTDATWTDVVNEVATLATLVIANTNAGAAINVSIRLSGGLVIVPTTSIAAGGAFVLEVRSINVTSGESLQANISAAGVNILASGAI